MYISITYALTIQVQIITNQNFRNKTWPIKGLHKVVRTEIDMIRCVCGLDPVVDQWSRSSRLKIGQVELIKKSSTSRSSRVDFSTSRVDRLVDD